MGKRSKTALKVSNSQDLVCDLLDRYISAFLEAKGRKPPSITITGHQSVQFGLNSGDQYQGVAINIL